MDTGTILLIVVFFVLVLIIILLTRKDSNRKNKPGKSPKDIVLNDKNPENNKQFKKKIKGLKEKDNELDNKIKELDGKIKKVNNRIQDLENIINTLQNSINNLIKSNGSFDNNDLKYPRKSPPQSNTSNNSENKKLVNNKNGGTGSHGANPQTIVYESLTVRNEKLSKAEDGDVVYYISWEENGKKYFEFKNNERTKKAINNRSNFIEPFCKKSEDSRMPDESDSIISICPGTINKDYTIIEKNVIKYQ